MKIVKKTVSMVLLIGIIFLCDGIEPIRIEFRDIEAQPGLYEAKMQDAFAKYQDLADKQEKSVIDKNNEKIARDNYEKTVLEYWAARVKESNFDDGAQAFSDLRDLLDEQVTGLQPELKSEFEVQEFIEAMQAELTRKATGGGISVEEQQTPATSIIEKAAKSIIAFVEDIVIKIKNLFVFDPPVSTIVGTFETLQSGYRNVVGLTDVKAQDERLSAQENVSRLNTVEEADALYAQIVQDYASTRDSINAVNAMQELDVEAALVEMHDNLVRYRGLIHTKLEKNISEQDREALNNILTTEGSLSIDYYINDLGRKIDNKEFSSQDVVEKLKALQERRDRLLDAIVARKGVLLAQQLGSL